MHPSVPLILCTSHVAGFGLSSYWKLCEAFGSLERALTQNPDVVEALLPTPTSKQVLACTVDPENDSYVEQTLDWCAANQVDILSHHDPRYPQRLREIKRGPPLLYVRGNAAVLDMPQIAIVGSRAATQAGKSNARSMAMGLVNYGLAVTSGLALGIDTQAHRGALEGSGATLAVIGNGIDTIYPFKNRNLAEQIVAGGGAIVSEFPLHTSPKAINFPRRNRIISGLSIGTLVVEAAIKSGSLISARFALEQNREVFAMPGSIHNPLSRGCHLLIKQGAVLVEEVEDIVQELAGFMPRHHSAPFSQLPLSVDLSEDEKNLLDFLEHDPCTLDALVSRSQLPIDKLLANLMSLELMGLVTQESGAYLLNATQPAANSAS